MFYEEKMMTEKRSVLVMDFCLYRPPPLPLQQFFTACSTACTVCYYFEEMNTRIFNKCCEAAQNEIIIKNKKEQTIKTEC